MLICYCSLHQETWKSAKRWRQLDNPKVRPKVLKFFPIHFFRRWLNPHISYQLSVGWGWKLTIMHVAVYIFWLSNLWTNKASDYRNTIRKRPLTVVSDRQVSAEQGTASLAESRELCPSFPSCIYAPISASPVTLCCHRFSSFVRQNWEKKHKIQCLHK